MHPAGGEEKFTKQMAPGFNGQAAFPLTVTVKCMVLCHVGWYHKLWPPRIIIIKKRQCDCGFDRTLLGI